MKTLPTPIVSGSTEAQRFSNAVQTIFTVNKEEMQRREAEWQKANGKKPKA